MYVAQEKEWIPDINAYNPSSLVKFSLREKEKALQTGPICRARHPAARLYDSVSTVMLQASIWEREAFKVSGKL